MGVIQNPNGSYQISNTALQQFIPAANLLRDTIIHVAHGFSTVHADMDFETYSEAGYVFDAENKEFVAPPNAASGKKGLKLVGSAVYARHPSTAVLSLAYNLKDGLGKRIWVPEHGGAPHDLFAYIASGGLIEAHNAIFEYEIWTNVCVPKLGWPPLPQEQLRCSMAKAASFALPMALEKLADALDAPIKKDTAGSALMKKMSVPRKPTRANPNLRYTPAANPSEFERLYEYNGNDTDAESEVSAMLPDLQPEELELWLLDQKINARGVHIDKASLDNCIDIVEQAKVKYTEELRGICGGYYDDKGTWIWNVSKASEDANIRVWLATRGINTPSVDEEHRTKLLAREDLPADCRRVVEIRDSLGAASVKKLFSLFFHLCPDNRVRGLFAYCGADRTGRFAGRGPQPQNMPSGGPKLLRCDKISGCGHFYQKKLTSCPWCGVDAAFSNPEEWGPEAVDQALIVISQRNLSYVEHYFGDALGVISGCLRGLFTAAPGKDFISSDFSAIEAVVLAALAGEEWRMEVFRTHGKIYEMGASLISGVPFEEIMQHKKDTGEHHPLRKTIGKVSELASGYNGWIGAWKNFGADKFMTDDEIKKAILAWREASPAIVELWGGQWRKHPKKWEFSPEFYGLEGAVVQAIMNPGQAYSYRMLTYQVHQDVLYCRLPSGRLLCYHSPRLMQSTAPHGNPVWQITYMGQNSTTQQWFRDSTYSGKLAENCLSGSSLVLTERGWVRLDEISSSDMVHDGVDFVNHGGLLYKSVKPCVSMDGVLMTGDHNVLSCEGWQPASQCQRPYRPDIRDVDVCWVEPHGRQKEPLVLPLRMWETMQEEWLGCVQRGETWWDAELRMQDKRVDGIEAPHARYDQAPSVRSVEVDDRPLQATDTPSVAQLWGAWYSGLREVAGTIRELLGRRWSDVHAGNGVGQKGQRRELLPRKLSLGNRKGELQQPTEQRESADTLRRDDVRRDVRHLRDKAHNRAVSDREQLVSRGHDTASGFTSAEQKVVVGEFPVYDILNCGPRNRFVVKGDNGPFIVHNCCQAVARDILTYSMKNLEKAGYPIVLHIHDEIVAEVNKDEGSIEEFERIMAIMPPWASDWPIRAAGGWRGLRYRKG